MSRIIIIFLDNILKKIVMCAKIDLSNNKKTRSPIMINKIINLCPDKPHVTLTSYVHEDTSTPRTTVLVCPGGGYWMTCADYEGEYIAEYYYEAGFNAFVLIYSTAENNQITNLDPLAEVGLAVKYLRENASVYGVDPNKIATCGFSAGGHLAGSAGILWNIPEVKAAMGNAPEGINRPNAMILSYPVITAGKQAHRGSFENLTGIKGYGEDVENKFSLEKNVEPTTPPVFIWHTFNDSCVPVENSILLLAACAANKVPCEAHIYPNGPHGMGLAVNRESDTLNDPHVATWADLSAMWLKDIFK